MLVLFKQQRERTVKNEKYYSLHFSETHSAAIIKILLQESISLSFRFIITFVSWKI